MATLRVLVLGAGFGGLELSARLAGALGADVEVTLIDRAAGFVFGFSKLEVMFGRRTAADVTIPYSDLVHPRVAFHRETITAIEPAGRAAVTDQGRYEADVMVVALGADYDIAATPGLREGGHEFYSVAGAERVSRVLPGFGGGRAVVAVLGQPFKCPPAPSEAAFLLHDQLVRRGLAGFSKILLVSPFGIPIPPSPDGSRAILEGFRERGIEYLPDRTVERLDPTRKVVVLGGGEELPYDLFLGVPVHRVPEVVEESGLAEQGWIPVDKETLATRFEGVYAVGDVTSVGVPKAGVFAENAGRVVAEILIAGVRDLEPPAPYDGRGTCYVEMGEGRVGRIDADFLTGPRAAAPFTPASAQTAAEKAEFATVRRRRWSGA